MKNNHEYYFQVQCQLGLTGLDWCDFFCYLNDTTFLCVRINFDDFFQSAKDKVDMFFFNSTLIWPNRTGHLYIAVPYSTFPGSRYFH